MAPPCLCPLPSGRCGVLSACAFLRVCWPFAHLAPHMPPMALLNQLYFLLGNRTHVDRELARLQSNGHLRVFRMFANAEGHDLCVVRTADYVESIRAIMPPDTDADIAIQAAAPSTPQRSSAAAAPVRLSRPASLPVGSSAGAAAAAAAAAASSPPVKSHSSSTASASAASPVPVFAPWPSSRPTSASLAASAPPLQSQALAAAQLPPVPPGAATASATGARALERQVIRRKRSLPISNSSAAAASSSVAASARSSSAAPAVPVTSATGSKRAKMSDDPSPLASRASSSADAAVSSTSAISAATAATALSSPSPSSGLARDTSGLSTFTAGVNPKLHVNLSDTALDERFPALVDSHASHFSSRDARVLLHLFLTHLVPACSDISITQERLLSLIYFPHVRSFANLSSQQCVSALLRMNLIVFKSADSFYLTAPGVSRLLESLRSGRKELVAMVKKRSYKEMPLRELMALPRLKTSPCRVEFHLREMLGSEQHLMLVDTTMGPLVRLAAQDKST